MLEAAGWNLSPRDQRIGWLMRSQCFYRTHFALDIGMERRRHSRVAFHVEATIELPDEKVTGTIDNLSMKGMFLNTDRKLAGTQLLDIVIRLSGTELAINLKGEVVRNTDHGAAIEFREMD
ncbi:MAG: PilZ domain-containing protein, partial [Syntrophobacteraceae bacterium]